MDSITILEPTLSILGIIADVVSILGIISIIILLQRYLIQAKSSRLLSRFWADYYKKKVVIVFSEYETDSIQAKYATGGTVLTSKGVGLAMSHLQGFLETEMSASVRLIGHTKFTIREDDKHVIIIGTPPINNWADTFIKCIQETYILGYDIKLSAEQKRIEILNESKTPLHALLTAANEVKRDFALIIKAICDDTQVILVMGCLTYGTYEGARALTDPSVLNRVNQILSINQKKQANQNIAFVIRTEVFHDESRGPRIEKDHIALLEPKH